MIQILDGLYLGNRDAACDLPLLLRARITHIVNCADELPNYHEDRFQYLALKLHDPDPELHRHIRPVCLFIDQARKNRGRVLVHCFAAVSRSPSIVLAYLCHLGDSLDVAAKKLGRMVWTDPDLLFLQQLAQHLGTDHGEETLHRLSAKLMGR